MEVLILCLFSGFLHLWSCKYWTKVTSAMPLATFAETLQSAHSAVLQKCCWPWSVSTTSVWDSITFWQQGPEFSRAVLLLLPLCISLSFGCWLDKSPVETNESCLVEFRGGICLTWPTDVTENSILHWKYSNYSPLTVWMTGRLWDSPLQAVKLSKRKRTEQEQTSCCMMTLFNSWCKRGTEEITW